MPKHPKVGIIIPTLERDESLEACLNAIENQTYKNYEIHINHERGNLAQIRNDTASRSDADILVFIDDDTEPAPVWLQAIVDAVVQRGASGVSGPAIIRERYRSDRDLFRYRRIKRIYDRLFLDGRDDLPGHFSSWGAFTTGASKETCSYSGPVCFTEACNMSFTREAFISVGGFDSGFTKTSEWCEPDLCFKLGEKGHLLWFDPRASLYHNPSQDGAYKRRISTEHRIKNYERFAKKWFPKDTKHFLYRKFVTGYFKLKGMGFV